MDGAPPRRVVAAFDFDGTLTRRDTVLPFLVQVAGRAPVARSLAAQSPALVQMALGRGDRDLAKTQLIARVLSGREWEDVAASGRAFARRVIARGLRPDTVARLAWHRAEGHHIVIVSASLDAYLHEVAEQLGVDAVLCTTLERDERGRVTGRLVGGNCRGPEKVARLRAHVGDEPMLLWAYGDSSGDRELLALADRAVRVSRRAPVVPADAGAA
jgi:phosphatidylglycerophosphatase C